MLSVFSWVSNRYTGFFLLSMYRDIVLIFDGVLGPVSIIITAFLSLITYTLPHMPMIGISRKSVSILKVRFKCLKLLVVSGGMGDPLQPLQRLRRYATRSHRPDGKERQRTRNRSHLSFPADLLQSQLLDRPLLQFEFLN